MSQTRLCGSKSPPSPAHIPSGSPVGSGPAASWRAHFVDGHVFAALRSIPQWYGPGVPPLPQDERAAALQLADAYRAILDAAPTTLDHDKDLLGEPTRNVCKWAAAGPGEVGGIGSQ